MNDHWPPSVALLYADLTAGPPGLACLVHAHPTRPGIMQADARIPEAVTDRRLPDWWDGWLPVADGWMVARIDLSDALVSALLVGNGGTAKENVRKAYAQLSAHADAVTPPPPPTEDRYNPDLDDVMAA
jgi:hypothetical protein